MKATGIVCEYNPFHFGHKYQIEKTREKFPEDAIVCVMSGNFVQRGEPAILNKWERAKTAVENGADAVVELPVPFCIENSSIFSDGAISILESLGVSHISFGSESGNPEKIKKLSNFIYENSDVIERCIKDKVQEGLSYPRARAEIINSLTGFEYDSILKNSNDILALEYVARMKNAEPVLIKRINSEYNDKGLNGTFSSATAIREALYAGIDVANCIPEKEIAAIDTFLGGRKSDDGGNPYLERVFNILRYKVLSSSAEELNQIFGAEEGLGSLLKKNIRSCNSYDDAVNVLKSKRYTQTRIKRVILNTVLDITGDQVKAAKPYIRILAVSDRGAEYIKQVKKERTDLAFIDNFGRNNIKNSENSSILELNIKATDIYNQITGLDLYEYSEYVKKALKL